MSAKGAHAITEMFEKELAKYTGAPYAVAVDNCSNALFLALYYELNVQSPYDKDVKGYSYDRQVITIPRHTYPSVACEIIHAGAKVAFADNYLYWPELNEDSRNLVKGAYVLEGTKVIDSSLSFTANMYSGEVIGYHHCLSFTGPFKHLKLGKGGAILTDDINAWAWFKRARFSGRTECSYHDDDFDGTTIIGNAPPVAGWNFYMMPEIAARGLQMMAQFYDKDGKPKHNEDLCLPYPDLSKFKLWQ
jgi:hypothetical protein